MQEFFNQIIETVGTYVPKLLGALAILVFGWLIALVIAAVVRGVIRRTSLKNKLSGWIAGEEKADTVPLDRYVSRGVFYLLMLFVLVAFFQTLGLTLITEPLNNLLNEIFSFAPQFLGALVLLLIAWIVAAALRLIITRTLTVIKLDQRLKSRLGLEEEPAWSMTKMLANAVYWLVFLLFLPPVLTALALEGLLEPVQAMLSKILEFLPNIATAAIVLAIGWFLATIIQRIVSNVLVAVGTDQFSKKTGLEKMLGKQKLSGIMGLIVYILILIPVLIAALNTLALEAITQPASNMLTLILVALPAIFAAAILIIVSYVIGRVVAKLIANLLSGVGFDKVLAKLEVTKKQPAKGEKTPSEIVGYIVMAIIILFAVIEAADMLDLTQLSDLLAKFMTFTVQVILGLIIFGLGLFLANWVANRIKASKKVQAEIFAMISRVSILIFAGAMALRQMGLATDIINLSFAFLLGAVAVATAIAFGIGGRDYAARQIEKWSRSIGGGAKN